MKLTGLFVPGVNSSMANLGLLVLRVWVGVAMLCNHGWDKLIHFSQTAGNFPDPLHIGSTVSLVLAILAEFACSALLAVGLITRLAALVLVIHLTVAFIVVHKMALTGAQNGELAFIYLAGYVTIFLAGPGQYSADAVIFGKSS